MGIFIKGTSTKKFEFNQTLTGADECLIISQLRIDQAEVEIVKQFVDWWDKILTKLDKTIDSSPAQKIIYISPQKDMMTYYVPTCTSIPLTLHHTELFWTMPTISRIRKKNNIIYIYIPWGDWWTIYIISTSIITFSLFWDQFCNPRSGAWGMCLASPTRGTPLPRKLEKFIGPIKNHSYRLVGNSCCIDSIWEKYGESPQNVP